MKRLPYPNITARYSYLTCVSGVVEPDLKHRLKHCCNDINEQTDKYIDKAGDESLFSLVPIRLRRRKEDPIVIGNVLKSELVKLYDYYMVQKQPARVIYDKILVAANDKCPFCGEIGHPKTLDHYLPKANYPQFSVFPLNLVPACRDCNTEKRNTLATSAHEQVLHPYLDDECFFSEQWIFARIIRVEPCSLVFHVAPPDDWPEIWQNRVKKHFEDFNLAKRYSIEAAKELSIVIDQRTGHMLEFSSEEFSQFLKSIGSSSLFFANHWKKVMYQTLANDEWFCEKPFSSSKS